MQPLQNLGAMDILCTDKTGTLTQDQVLKPEFNFPGWAWPRHTSRLVPYWQMHLPTASCVILYVHAHSHISSLLPAEVSPPCDRPLRTPGPLQVVLTRWLDWRGVESGPALRFAFLKAFLQTGARNLLDSAILDSGGRSFQAISQ